MTSREFYADFGRSDVEFLARAICKDRGYDPDTLVPETGYPSARRIPLWWKHQDAARNFIAMRDALAKERNPSHG